MSRLEELTAISRERSLTDAEIRAVLQLSKPSYVSAKKRARWWAKCKDKVNARKRERYATDPEYRARLLAKNEAWRLRRKAKR